MSGNYLYQLPKYVHEEFGLMVTPAELRWWEESREFNLCTGNRRKLNIFQMVKDIRSQRESDAKGFENRSDVQGDKEEEHERRNVDEESQDQGGEDLSG